MRKFLTILLVWTMILITATAFAKGLKRQDDTNLILWLEFESEDMKDSSPKNTAFTAFVPGKIVEGIIGNTWQFEEGTEIGIGQAFKDPFTESTFSVWIKKSAEKGVLYEEGGGTNGFCVQIMNRVLHYCTRDNGAATCLQVDFPVDDEEWHLVTAVFNGSMELYLDGELVAHENNVPGIGSHANETGIGKVGAGTAGIACSSDAGQWIGIMDELLVTRRTISPQEIKEEFDAAGDLSVEPIRKLAITWGNIKRR